MPLRVGFRFLVQDALEAPLYQFLLEASRWVAVPGHSFPQADATQAESLDALRKELPDDSEWRLESQASPVPAPVSAQRVRRELNWRPQERGPLALKSVEVPLALKASRPERQREQRVEHEAELEPARQASAAQRVPAAQRLALHPQVSEKRAPQRVELPALRAASARLLPRLP